MSAHKTYENVPVHVRHVTEEHRTVNADKTVTTETLPGHLEIGVMVDGAFVRIARIKAAGVLADIARAQAEAAKSASSSE